MYKRQGLCGLDGHTITCSRKSDVDLGYVGNVEKVDTTLIEHLLNDGFIPVIATVGMDENGIAYNINACLLYTSILAKPCIDGSGNWICTGDTSGMKRML